MTFKPFHHLTLQVAAVQSYGNDITCVVLQDPDGWDLPPFEAGAHIEVQLPCGVRHYSLCGDPGVRTRYELAVLAEPNGRGGSMWIHDNLSVGDVLFTSIPRNYFRLNNDYSHYLLIAGGIGVTPLRSMSYALDRLGKPYELWYSARDELHAAYLDELRARIPPEHLKLAFCGGAEERQLDFDALLSNVRDDTAIYCCGPTGLMDAVREATKLWPAGSVSFEAFSGPDSDKFGSTPQFDVELSKSGVTISVREGQTILQAMREHEIEVPSSCEAGVCRSCITNYHDGTPVHRDLVLTPEERKASMLICVSGCTSKRIVLDI